MIRAPKQPDWEALRRLFTQFGQTGKVFGPKSDDAAIMISDMVADFAEDLALERAAIMEFDGGLSPDEAEKRAGLNTSWK